ncbi:hypothetical protein GCM10009682_20140 [Luedemannella flava]|uniref:MFS transporter n=1 Tax=Luedemannella flava TaxID=349316 RepID=A0ABN2LTS9_9ACTN
MMSTTLAQSRFGPITWANGRRSLLFTAAATRAANFSLISIIARYLSDQGFSAGTIGIVLAAAGLTSAASQAGWARLITRQGPALAGIVAATLGTVGCAMLGFASVPVTLIAADVVLSAGFTGLATTVRTVTGTQVDDEAEGERRFGQLSSWQTVGGLVGPLLLGSLVIGSSDIAPWFAGGLSAAVLVLWVVLAWRSRAAARPAEEVGEAADDRPGSGSGTARAWRLAWTMRLVLLCTVGTSFLYGANVVLWGLYLKDLGANPAVTAWSFAVFSAPMVLISPRAGRIWGRVPRTAAITVGSVSLGAMAIVYGSVQNMPLAVALTLVEGSLMALTMPIIAAHVSALLPEKDVAHGYALYGGVDITLSVLGTAAGGGLIALIGVGPTWYVCGVLCIACAALAWALRTRPQPVADPA